MLRLAIIRWNSVFMASPLSAFHRFQKTRVEPAQFPIIELYVVPLVFLTLGRVGKGSDDGRGQYGSRPYTPYDSYPAPHWKLRYIGLSLRLCTHLSLFSFYVIEQIHYIVIRYKRRMQREAPLG